MKKLIIAILLCLNVTVGYSEDFYIGLTTSGCNFWTTIPQTPVRLLGSLLDVSASSLNYDWINASDPQGKLDIDNGNFFGFKAKDIFNNFSYGVTLGYQPFYSPFGIYGKASYKYRQFRMQDAQGLGIKEKYQVPSWSAGVGVRITPFISLLEDGKCTPIIEVGTNYNKVFSCRAPYSNDDSQFGSGLSTNFGVGLRFMNHRKEKSFSVALNFELSQYDYFNRDFTLLNGTKPYSDIKSKYYSIGLTFYSEF